MLEAGTWKLQLEMCGLGEPTDHLGVKKTLGALRSSCDPGGPAALIGFPHLVGLNERQTSSRTYKPFLHFSFSPSGLLVAPSSHFSFPHLLLTDD